jgi:NAD(P)-dependent dehydrogenase (short-subunit alcohol dehydrogenase family)
MNAVNHSSTPAKAWIITGPTSGIGRRTALDLAQHGTVVLVGRNSDKLKDMEAEISAEPGGRAVSVVCDFSDIPGVRRAADEIAALGLPLAGLLNNAGIMPLGTRTTAQGWDLAFTTNHLGPFTLTDALIPHLPDSANVVFICSAVEDPARRPAVFAGFRGGRYISAEASVRGEWQPGGSSKPGYDAYATSKQCNLATVLALAREFPRLRFSAVEPGLNPGTGLGRDAAPALRFLAAYVLSPLAPLIKYWSTPKHAARVITQVLTEPSDRTGVYYNENGKPMQGSAQVRDAAFSDRVVTETRALLANASGVALLWLNHGQTTQLRPTGRHLVGRDQSNCRPGTRGAHGRDRQGSGRLERLAVRLFRHQSGAAGRAVCHFEDRDGRDGARRAPRAGGTTRPSAPHVDAMGALGHVSTGQAPGASTASGIGRNHRAKPSRGERRLRRHRRPPGT